MLQRCAWPLVLLGISTRETRAKLLPPCLLLGARAVHLTAKVHAFHAASQVPAHTKVGATAQRTNTWNAPLSDEVSSPS